MYLSIENQELEMRKAISCMSRAVSPQFGRHKSFVEIYEDVLNGFVGHEVKARQSFSEKVEEQRVYREMQENRELAMKIHKKTQSLFRRLFEAQSD